jgi:hypothetical protein
MRQPWCGRKRSTGFRDRSYGQHIRIGNSIGLYGVAVTAAASIGGRKMKKSIVCFLMLIAVLLLNPIAVSAEKAQPFGLQVGRSTYENCIKIFKTRNWTFQEYEKKQFKLIDEKSPQRGKNTFIIAKLDDMKGAKSVRLFFSNKAILDAVIITLEPDMFYVVMDELDRKYDLVKKNFMGEDFTENYTFVLWQKQNLYIELQRLSAHFVRLLYVEKVLFENYKDFLFKPYESFRRRQVRPEWMEDL